MRHLKNFAGFIGAPFTALCGDKELGRRKRRILRKVFLLFCWSAGICALCAKRRGDCGLYLLSALKNFLADERRRAMAIKRGKGERLIPLEQLRAEEWGGMEPIDQLTAER